MEPGYPKCKYYAECSDAGTGQDEGVPGMGMCRLLVAYTLLAIDRTIGVDKTESVPGTGFECVDGQDYVIPN